MIAQIFGYGHQRGQGQVYTREENPGINLLPKLSVRTVVKDEIAEKIIEKALVELNTGSFGDGKIFVRAVEDAVKIRTYERGVEAESGACGTGAVAAAVTGVARRLLRFPVRVATAHGFELVVDGEFDGGAFRNVTLAGPVAKVYEGSIELPTK